MLVVADTPYVITYRVLGGSLELIALFHGRQKIAQYVVAEFLARNSGQILSSSRGGSPPLRFRIGRKQARSLFARSSQRMPQCLWPRFSPLRL